MLDTLLQWLRPSSFFPRLHTAWPLALIATVTGTGVRSSRRILRRAGRRPADLPLPPQPQQQTNILQPSFPSPRSRPNSCTSDGALPETHVLRVAVGLGDWDSLAPVSCGAPPTRSAAATSAHQGAHTRAWVCLIGSNKTSLLLVVSPPPSALFYHII